MTIAKLLLKTTGVSVLVLSAVVLVAVFMYEAGASEGVVLLVESVAFAVYGYTQSKEWGSGASWAWGVLGFVAGAFSFPIVRFCYESNLANSEQAKPTPQSVPVSTLGSEMAPVRVGVTTEDAHRGSRLLAR